MDDGEIEHLAECLHVLSNFAMHNQSGGPSVRVTVLIAQNTAS